MQQPTKHIVKVALTNRFVDAAVFTWAQKDSVREDIKPLAESSSRHLPAESFQKKFNRADKEACVVVAKDFSQKLQAAGVSTVQLAGAPKYHGRVKAFIEELRRNGIKC